MIFINPDEECPPELQAAAIDIVMKVRQSTDPVSGLPIDHFTARLLLQLSSGESETWRITIEHECEDE